MKKSPPSGATRGGVRLKSTEGGSPSGRRRCPLPYGKARTLVGRGPDVFDQNSQEMRVRGVEHTGHINASWTFESDQSRSGSKRGYPRHFAHRGLASRAQKRVGACASRLLQHRSYLSLGRFGSASFIGTNVNVPPRSSAMTTASAPSGLPDLIASAHSSRADNNACRRAACAVGA